MKDLSSKVVMTVRCEEQGEKPMRLILLGPPGAGKGTQAQKLARQYDLYHLSTGDVLREALETGTELGRKAKAYIDKGELVPDEVVIGLVKEKLGAPEVSTTGFLLDGFPRTLAQAKALDALLEELDQELDAVVNLEVQPLTIVDRLAKRRVCKECKASFHLEFTPPKVAGVCDYCGGELYQRSDDQEDTILRRLNVYQQQTEPLITYYAQQDLVVNVDGELSVDEVSRVIGEQLEELTSKHDCA